MTSNESTTMTNRNWSQISSTFNLPNRNQKKPSEYQFIGSISDSDEPNDMDVFLARRRLDNQPCSIKVMRKKKYIEDKKIDETFRELDILKSLRHKYIVPIYSAFINKDHLFLEMEFGIRGTLESLINEDPMMASICVRFYTSQMVIALDYLRSQQIVHRDLRPANVLINHKGYIKLTNFSCAIHIPENLCISMVPRISAYSAPEMIGLEDHDFAVDWWSLGVIMFQMIYNSFPFISNVLGEQLVSRETYIQILLEAIEHGVILFPNGEDDARRNLSANKFIRRLLSPEPGDRLMSMNSIKKRTFFSIANIKWEDLLNEKIPSPHLPSEVRLPWNPTDPPNDSTSNEQDAQIEEGLVYPDWQYPVPNNHEYEEDVFSTFFYLP
ncbi:kinase-like domain-containing protein [Phakopsora pachyrhizi]|nr:kinase-like domain-containing protein [Phakopsora pachyrhizi]